MNRKDDLRARLGSVREKTLWLLDQVPDAFLRRRVHSFYSPIGWHFGHVGRTEEHWVCRAVCRPPCDEHLSFVFADLPENPKDNRVNIPDRAGIVAYLERTRQVALEALDRANLGDDDPLLADGYAWEFALQHECQHQETIAEMLCLIHQAIGPRQVETLEWTPFEAPAMPDIPGGVFVMGTDDRHAYDNEKRSHVVAIEGFELAPYPVTAFEWTRFMEEGGYSRPELWSPEGWAWRESENATQPEYWLRQPDGGWSAYGTMGVRALHPHEPATSISWYEADAYARWAGARLPSEEEWEYAASGLVERVFPWGDVPAAHSRARYGLEGFGPAPVGSYPKGASPFGVHDMAGNSWEWTASAFLPYPGFEPFPYDGYSKAHMDGRHMVCRGGSWATAEPILRCSFRNWYVPSYRQGFLGVRLARG